MATARWVYNGNPRDTINRGESFFKADAQWRHPQRHELVHALEINQDLENGDIDLGSAGILLIPGTTLAFSGGKQGVGYLVNRDNMGGLSFSSADKHHPKLFAYHGPASWRHGLVGRPDQFLRLHLAGVSVFAAIQI